MASSLSPVGAYGQEAEGPGPFHVRSPGSGTGARARRSSHGRGMRRLIHPACIRPAGLMLLGPGRIVGEDTPIPPIFALRFTLAHGGVHYLAGNPTNDRFSGETWGSLPSPLPIVYRLFVEPYQGTGGRLRFVGDRKLPGVRSRQTAGLGPVTARGPGSTTSFHPFSLSALSLMFSMRHEDAWPFYSGGLYPGGVGGVL